MLALYRSGRQTDALAAYRDARRVLVEAFGVEPVPALQQLERAILQQDPTLEPTAASPTGVVPSVGRAILVLARDRARLDMLLALARPLAQASACELFLADLVEDERELPSAAAELNALCKALPVLARCAVFTSRDPGTDVPRLARAYDVGLVLLDSTPQVLGDRALPDELAAILADSPADVGLLVGNALDLQPNGGVYVPFGGGEHDWAALELAAWLASTAGLPLLVVGTGADTERGRRDASRLLADASLAVQRVIGVESEPLLAEPTEEALLAAVGRASLIVVGVTQRWRQDGIGETRRALVRAAPAPVLLIHRGLRPGGLAPRESLTRFTWSIER
jgi:nucleotide-binding universal stress UspA family protein